MKADLIKETEEIFGCIDSILCGKCAINLTAQGEVKKFSSLGRTLLIDPCPKCASPRVTTIDNN